MAAPFLNLINRLLSSSLNLTKIHSNLLADVTTNIHFTLIFLMDLKLVFNIYFGFMFAFWCHVCPKVSLFETSEKQPKVFL